MNKQINAEELRSQIATFGEPSKLDIFKERIKAADAIRHTLDVPPFQQKAKQAFVNGLPQFDLTIRTVNGLCGSGKTHALCKQVAETVGKYVIAVPTRVLANQYKTALINNGIYDAAVIHGGNTGTVKKDIFQAIDNDVRVIVITQSALQQEVHHKIDSTYRIVLDEIPSIDSFDELRIPHNLDIIRNFFSIDESYENDNLYHVVISKQNRKLVAAFIKKQRDAHDKMWEHIYEFIADTYEGNFVVVDKQSWDRLVIVGTITPDEIDEAVTEYGNQMNTLYYLSITTPKIFSAHNLTIMGANFNESMLYHIWSTHFGVKFVTDHLLESKLRYTSHNNGSLLTAHWMQEEKVTKHNLGKGVREKYIDQVTKFFGSEPTIFVTNKDAEELKPASWTHCPTVAHGLNTYDQFTNIYFDAALNRKPKHYTMLSAFGISSSIAIRSSAHEIMYQAIMRTALRQPDNTQMINVVVADREMVKVLVELFPEMKTAQLGDAPRKSKLSKHQRYRINKSKDEKLTGLDAILEKSEKTATNPYIEGMVALSSDFLEINTNVYIKKEISVTKHPEAHESVSYSPIGFRNMMRDASREIFTDKGDQVLINNAKFSLTIDGKKSRLKEDAIAMSMVILDIDDGEMSHEKFSEIFSDVSHFTCNSFSRDENHENYRVYMYINQLVTPEVYHDIMMWIIKRVKDAGYHTLPRVKPTEADLVKYLEQNPNLDPKDLLISGIDMSKIGGTDLFYAPCMRDGYEDFAFFKHYNCKDDGQIKARAINPRKIIIETPVHREVCDIIFVEEPVVYTGGNSKLNEIRAQLAKQDPLAEQKAKVEKLINELGSSNGNRWKILGEVSGALCKTSLEYIESVESRIIHNSGSHSKDAVRAMQWSKSHVSE
jgi:hypothetical protein